MAWRDLARRMRKLKGSKKDKIRKIKKEVCTKEKYKLKLKAETEGKPGM
jgi:hypothetical protein